LGVGGVSCLFIFYFLTVFSSWHASRRTDVLWAPLVFRMMAASILGFAISAAFVTVEGFELPFYVALIGACARKIAYDEQLAATEYDEYHLTESDHAWSGGWAGAR
jgi:hypothetical protein